MSVKEQLRFLKRLAIGLAEQFGPNCEVTVHDFSKGSDHSIVAIENGHVTGRHIGDGSSEIVLKALKDHKKNVKDQYNYLARTKEGRIVKSSTVYLREDDGTPVGLFGINYDITDLIMAQKAIEAIASVPEPETPGEIGTTIATNVTDLLDILIKEADDYVAKPVAMMTKEDKTRAIQYLNDKGAFLVKKAGDKVSKHYDISKYTLYNYMDAESI